MSKKSLTNDQWIEELDMIVDKIKNDHYDPFVNLTESQFDSAVNELRTAIPGYSDGRVIAGFARLVASFGWGHTRINLPVNYTHLGYYQGHKLDAPHSEKLKAFRCLPVRFVKFEEGVFIQSSTNRYRKLLGRKVVGIGKLSIDDALERITPYVSVENQSALQLMGPVYLSITDLMFIEGIIDNPNEVLLVFDDGTRELVQSLSPTENVEFIDLLTHQGIQKPKWLQGTAVGMWQVSPAVDFWTRPEQYFWYKYLPEDQVLYLKINYIAEHPNMSLATFMHNAMKVAEEKKAKKIVLDLRHDTGGMGDSNRAIILALQRWSGISNFGSAFVLIGRQTYSAAILLALELEKNANVIFVGEDLGGKPDHIGDSQRFVLPHSHLTFRVSVAKHDDWTGMTNRPSVWVHYEIPLSFADYRSGNDGVLDFARKYAPADLSQEIIKIYRNTNINVAILILYHIYTDPRETQTDHASLAHHLGRYLFEQEQNLGYAKYVTNVSLEYNAGDVPLLLLKAEMAIQEEEYQVAQEALDQILKSNPRNEKALKLLTEIK